MSTNVPDIHAAARVIHAAKEGNWLPPAEFLRLALTAAAAAEDNVTMSLLGVDHLDGEALQILLALRADCRKHGKQLLLTQVSPGLSRWFMYAGAEHHLSWS